MPQKRKSKDNSLNPRACIFCMSAEDNEPLLGKFLENVIRVHTNCLFFASGLTQRGIESDGFLGFLIPDIEAELRRGRKLFCYYCKKRGATVGCTITTCRKSFHLVCGIRNGSLHQFYDTFRSYCINHKPKQRPLVPDEYYCHLCCEEITSGEIESCLYPPCCKRNLLHKFCLQRYALSAGMFFIKCPFCNNTRQFFEEMRRFGINIPEKDASWELEDNAFEELLRRPDCVAPKCKCPRGRNYCASRKCGWTLLSCFYCGSHAMHVKCGNINPESKWICDECTEILENEYMRNCKVVIKKLPEAGFDGLKEECKERKWVVKLRRIEDIIVSLNKRSSDIIAINNFLPSVVLQDCLTTKNPLSPKTHHEAVLKSGYVSHIENAYQSSENAINSSINSENSETVELGNVVMKIKTEKIDPMDIDETSVAAGPSVNFEREDRKDFLFPTIHLSRCTDSKANLKDIKNVPRKSRGKRIRNGPRTRSAGKIIKKEKVEEGQTLITSYFMCNNEKNIRL